MDKFSFEDLNAYKEQLRFIEISYGSLMEVLYQLQLAKDLNYISDVEMTEKREQIQTTAKLISGLRASLAKTLNAKH